MQSDTPAWRDLLRVLVLVVGPLLTLSGRAASAQVKIENGPFSLTTEAWLNASGGGALDKGDRRDDARGHVVADGALRLLGLYRAAPDLAIGPRVVVASDTDDAVRLDQGTLLAQGDWGRFEIGRRQGLPDVLVGYAPNPYTYTSAEFGPASGISLDPDGGLPTRFLRSGLREQIDALSYLGNTPALSNDRAVKGLYVSPRLSGFIFGLAYTPDAGSAPGGRSNGFNSLLQSGISYEIYSGQEVYRLGVSYTFGDGEGAVRDLHSVSGGASVSLDDLLTEGSTTILGLNVSSDGGSGIVRPRRGGDVATAIGVTLSVNYEIGPWIAGGYYQFARAEGDTAREGNDRLHVLELGASYRFTRELRLFTAAYLFDLDDEGRGGASRRGAVLLLGMRATL